MTAIQIRLEELRREREEGVAQLELFDLRRSNLRATLLRIEGAIQVLEEVAADDGAGEAALEASG